MSHSGHHHSHHHHKHKHDHNHSHDHNHDHNDANSSNAENTTDHLIWLLQNKFISPYKVMFLLDKQQADHFKQRNQHSCCNQTQITIPAYQQTSTEKHLQELISYANLKNQLEKILTYAHDRLTNIIESGKKQKLQVNRQVEKYLLDKVMAQTANQIIFNQLKQIVNKQSLSMHKEIGLWATPATWYAQHPSHALNFLSSQTIASLSSSGWSIQKDFCQSIGQLISELKMLEKDGKFEESSWLSSCNLSSKVLNNPFSFIEMHDSKGDTSFPALRQISIRLGSIPFELNSKANLFCTVSPNLCVYFSQQTFSLPENQAPLNYTVYMNTDSLKITIENYEFWLSEGSLVILDNKRIKCKISSREKQLFLFNNYIGCAARQ